MTLIATLLPLMQYALYFSLGYQTCKVLRKWKDDEAFEELHRLICEKIKETDTYNRKEDAKKVKIDEGDNQDATN